MSEGEMICTTSFEINTIVRFSNIFEITRFNKLITEIPSKPELDFFSAVRIM